MVLQSFTRELKKQMLGSINHFNKHKENCFIGKKDETVRKRRPDQAGVVCIQKPMETRITVTLSAQPRLTASLASCWQADSNLSSSSVSPGFCSTLVSCCSGEEDWGETGRRVTAEPTNDRKKNYSSSDITTTSLEI